MQKLKMLLVFALMFVVSGCATHAKIDMPVISKVNKADWHGKEFRYEIYYSQPQPGIISGGQQQDLKPLSEAELSVGSAQVLGNLPQILADQLPLNAVVTDSEGADYQLRIEMVAHHKLGPTYPDYEFAKSFVKNLLTIGMAADEYNIIADFDITYFLKAKDGKEFQKHFVVKDSVDHERGSTEFKNNTFDYSAVLLRKYIITTSSEFLLEASNKI